MNLWHHDKFLHHHDEQHFRQIEQRDFSDFGLVSSAVFMWLLFVYVSPSVFFHHPTFHLILIHTSSSFSESVVIPKHCKLCIYLATVFWQILSCSIVGLVLRRGFVGHNLELFTVVTHVLFVDDESRGDSTCQFACFLFQVIELPFLHFFVARSSLDLRHRPVKSSRFSFSASSCPIFPITFCHLLKKEGQTLRESKWREREHKEMMLSTHSRGVPWAACVTHTQVTQSQETHYWCQTQRKNQPTHSPWLILVHQLRLSVMLKKTRQQETSF